ncbi:MAG: hypothetical protein ABFE07_28340 [Armatimonadia bacterium]
MINQWGRGIHNSWDVPQGPYTHRDASGMGWRFEGSRPISALADEVMRNVERQLAQKKAKGRKGKRKAAPRPAKEEAP